jgi:NADH-quinone oxidoreductase subunit L
MFPLLSAGWQPGAPLTPPMLAMAIIGSITALFAATIAVAQSDIKKVLAYSTISQLGFMLAALGIGAYVAAAFHLVTHAFFKALLFLGSGSVIHATHTNEMPKMGGLWRKMPWTAGTMLVGCLAIAGAGIPLLIGLSGYYSKDAILAQLFWFKSPLNSPTHAWLFYAATGGAALTAFYMFRLWYLTFLGRPRDKHVHEHAHESPPVMYLPLVVLAAFAVFSGGTLPFTQLSLPGLLEQARPAGTGEGVFGGQLWPGVTMPAEHLSHAEAIHVPVTLIAFGVALTGFLLATAFYGLRRLNPGDVRRTFPGLYWFLRHKWWFDELYALVFIRPVMAVARAVAAVDKQGIDWLADSLARGVRAVSSLDDWIDRTFVDGLVNFTARGTYATGLWLRRFQTGQLRQYVMLIVIGTVALFVLISMY